MSAMDQFKEALMNQNPLAWGALIVFAILVLRILKSAGKMMLILLALFALGLVLSRYFPQLVEPIADFIRGDWMGEQVPTQ